MAGAYIGLAAAAAWILVSGTALTGGIALAGVLLFAMLGAAALGSLTERFAYRPLRQAPRLAPLITAIGVSFVLQNVVMLLCGPVDKRYPEILAARQYSFGLVSMTHYQIIILIVSVTLMLGLHLFIKKTRTGKAMRAMADDTQAASLMGIPVDRTVNLAFVMGSAMAGAGGVLFGLYYHTVNFHDGYLAGLKAFTAAVLGGIGNIPGAMLGGLLLGVAEGLGAGYLSSEWKNVFAFLVLIAVLLFRPQGILGTRVVKKV